ncbi:hypothetical protein Tco_0089800 [Tanacetum coccineum]
MKGFTTVVEEFCRHMKDAGQGAWGDLMYMATVCASRHCRFRMMDMGTYSDRHPRSMKHLVSGLSRDSTYGVQSGHISNRWLFVLRTPLDVYTISNDDSSISCSLSGASTRREELVHTWRHYLIERMKQRSQTTGCSGDLTDDSVVLRSTLTRERNADYSAREYSKRTRRIHSVGGRAEAQHTKRTLRESTLADGQHHSHVTLIAQVDQESQIKMIQVKEMMQDERSQELKVKRQSSHVKITSMNDQSTLQTIQDQNKGKAKLKSQIFNVIGGTGKFEEKEDLQHWGDC